MVAHTPTPGVGPGFESVDALVGGGILQCFPVILSTVFKCVYSGVAGKMLGTTG